MRSMSASLGDQFKTLSRVSSIHTLLLVYLQHRIRRHFLVQPMKLPTLFSFWIRDNGWVTLPDPCSGRVPIFWRV